MKKKFLFALVFACLAVCFMAFAVSAEIITYDDAPVRTKYQATVNGEIVDIVEFTDGAKYPVSYVLKDTSIIDRCYEKSGSSIQNYFDFEYLNGKTGKNYTFEDVVGFDIPEGITYVGKYAGRSMTTLKWISFPKTVTKMDGAIFQGNSVLEECTFEHTKDSAITVFPGYTFYACSSLKAFSMPDCFTEIDDVGAFKGCTNLTALYLSENLIRLESGGGGSRNATFDDCTNLYFVNEPFTYDSIPQKPEVYYFPKNLEFITNNSVFRGCANLNNVLVFGEKITEMKNEYMFQNSPKNTVVFLGDMTKVAPMYWGSTATIIFANPNDKDASSVELVPYTGNYGHACSYYFCSTGNKYAANKNSLDAIIATLEVGANCHLAEKTMGTDATCTLPKMVASYCFCGQYIPGTETTEGDALGHSNTVILGYVYENYMADGYCSRQCDRCGEVSNEDKIDALFTSLGISAKTFGDGIGLTQGYALNRAAISAYADNTEGFDFGVLAYANLGGTEVAPKPGDDKVVDIVFDNMANDYIDVMISGIPDEHKDTAIVLCIYVKDKGGFYYLNNGNTTEAVVGNTYNEVVG